MIPRQSVTHIPVEDLIGHTRNVRKQIGDVRELAASIREHGLLQPVVVTEHPTSPGKWLLLAGHRRTAAARMAGLPRVPAVIRHDQDDITDQIALMLVENHQRANLGPVEKAEALKALIDSGLSQSEVARRVGMHVSTVNTFLLILDLDDESLEDVRAGEVTVTEAREAVKVQRAEAREHAGTPVRGRPVQVEPAHFRHTHPLAANVHDRCDHSTRPVVGSIGCGQCWEDVIRADARGEVLPEIQGGGLPMRASRNQPVDDIAVQRRIEGDHAVHLNATEKAVAVERLHGRGLSDYESARQLGYPKSSLQAIRSRLGLPANFAPPGGVSA